MRIDFAISSLRTGGGERVLATIANNLVNRGNTVRVITFSEPIEYETHSKIELVKLHSGSFKNQTLRYIIKLYKYYKNKNNRPDVIISFMTQTSLSVILVAKLLGIKVIASEHTSHIRTSTHKGVVNFTRKYIYRLANYVTILTKFDKEFYKKHGANAVVLPNPCSFKKINTPKENKDKIILAVGALHKYHIKGFDNLLPIVQPILHKHKDWKLMIVGETKNEGYPFLKNLAKDLKIENQVIFTGLRNDVKDIMANSEIFVLSSRNEGLPMVLLEAMSQDMCCIAFDCISGPSDIITNNVNGILIENQNYTEMTKVLTHLIETPELRLKLSSKANTITAKFNEDLICDKWEDLIKN